MGLGRRWLFDCCLLPVLDWLVGVIVFLFVYAVALRGGFRCC